MDEYDDQWRYFERDGIISSMDFPYSYQPCMNCKPNCCGHKFRFGISDLVSQWKQLVMFNSLKSNAGIENFKDKLRKRGEYVPDILGIDLDWPCSSCNGILCIHFDIVVDLEGESWKDGICQSCQDYADWEQHFDSDESDWYDTRMSPEDRRFEDMMNWISTEESDLTEDEQTEEAHDQQQNKMEADSDYSELYD